jgi:Tol biopolymer transport system component
MTDLEDRIRDALKDPRRQLPVWPDPMHRVRRAARRQRATLTAVTAAVAVAVVTPLALMSGLADHAARTHGHGPIAHGTPSPFPSALFAPSSGWSGHVPSWARGLPGEVAYNCVYNICLMNPDGSASRMLAAKYPEWDPAWSPSGRDLTLQGYYAAGDGQYDLYAVDIKGCHLTRLTHRLNGTSSSWSPDGRRIVFSTPTGLYVINANGTGLRKLIAASQRYPYSVDIPAWSASNRIAYTRLVPPHGRAEIYTVNPDGSDDAPLTRGAAGFGQPSWSPDGKSIAFTVDPYATPGSTSSIDVASANGAGARRVTPPSWTSYSPTWTPTGKIVFLRQTGWPRHTINDPTSAYIVNPDGSGLRLLYRNLDASQIAWGPTHLPRAGC